LGYLIYQQNTEGFEPVTNLPDWGYELYPVLPNHIRKVSRPVDVDGFEPIVPLSWGYELHPTLPHKLRRRLNRGQVVVEGFEPIVPPDWGYELHPTLPFRKRKNRFFTEAVEEFKEPPVPDFTYELPAILPHRIRKKQREFMTEGFEPIVPPSVPTWSYELKLTLPHILRKRLNRGQVLAEGLVPIVPPDWGYELKPTLPFRKRKNRFHEETEDYFVVPPIVVPDWSYELQPTLPHILKRRLNRGQILTEGFIPILNPPTSVPDFVQQVITLPVMRRKLNRGQVVITDYTEEILVLPGSGRLDGQYKVQYPVPYTGQLVQRGQYIGTYNPSNTSMSLNPAVIYYVPLVVFHPITIDRLGVYVTTPVSKAYCRIGVYRTELGIPGDKIADTGNIVLGTAGERSGLVNVSLSEGVYLLAIGCNGVGVQVRASDVRTAVLPESSGDSTQINTYYGEVVSGDFKELSTTPSNLTLTGGSAPRIFARRKM